MATTTAIAASPLHPWLDGFRRDPNGRFEKLISGAAWIPPYTGHAEPSDILASLLAEVPRDHGVRAELDGAVGAWLERRRQDTPDRRLEIGLNSYVDRITDALAMVNRLDLPETAKLLRHNYLAYVSWTDALVLGGSRDPRDRLWVAIARHQVNLGFARQWQGICDGVGRGRYPDYSLVSALFGLRQLPNTDRPALIRGALGGLAAWARHLPGTPDGHESFLTQWHALAYDFPEAKDRDAFQGIAAEIAAATHHSLPLHAWWTAALPRDRPPQPTGGRVELPRLDENERLIARIEGRKTPAAELEREVTALMARYRRYTEATGDTYNFVRSACDIGNRILRDRPGLALALAREAVTFELGNSHAWLLWARALARQGATELAEFVLWEAARRFPEDTFCRNALADLLAPLPGRAQEAETLLRDTAAAFPGDASCRNALGLLLVEQGLLDEAEGPLAELRALNAREMGTLAAAIHYQRQGLGKPVMEAEDQTPGPAADIESAPYAPILLRGRIVRGDRRLSVVDGTGTLRKLGQEDLEAVLAERPDSDHAWLVAVEHDVRPMTARMADSFPTSFAWLYRRGAAGDVDAWAVAERNHRDLGPMIGLARLVHGDAAADPAACARFVATPPPGPRRDDRSQAVAYVHGAVRALLGIASADTLDGDGLVRRLDDESIRAKLRDSLAKAARMTFDLDAPILDEERQAA